MVEHLKREDGNIGYEIHLTSSGSAQSNARPMVFVNGIGMTMGHWKAMIDALGAHNSDDAGYRCLVHDCMGQLFSDRKRESYSFEGHSADLAALMESTGFESAHLVGTSYGAEIVMDFALSYPNRCLSLTLIDGVSELDGVLRFAVESWRDTAGADPRLFYRTLIPWNYSPAYLDENREKLRQREDLLASLPEDYFTGFAGLCDAFLDIDLTSRLKHISSPTLVMVGELDIIKPRKFSEIIHREIRGSRLVEVASSGHAVVLEQPQEVARLIADFIESLN
jgi:3-oxoadipate enol-lactonase